MKNQYQQTLSSVIAFNGIGVHSGQDVGVLLTPAPENTGVVFMLSSGATQVAVKATWKNVVDTRLCTTLGHASGVKIRTVEHLMAAFAGCGVDNVRVYIQGEELPILDGSSLGFTQRIKQIGLRVQEKVRQRFKVLKTVRVEEGDAFLEISPSTHFQVTVEVPIKKASSQFFHYADSTPEAFETIASARTFSMLEDVQKMQAAGFIKGGSLENAVVLDGETVLNPEGLRYPDECARHKVLDIIGDFSLVGAPLLGHIKGRYPGHRLNGLLLQKWIQDETAWKRELLAAESQSSVDALPLHQEILLTTHQPVAVFGSTAYKR